MGPKKEPKVEPKVEEPKIEEPPPIPPHELAGYGRFEYPNGIIYEGHWRLINKIKMKHGQGMLKVPGAGPNKLGEESFTGNWVNDMMDGFGTYKYGSGAIYTGEWKENNQHGKGVYEFPDGSIYEGEWANHVMNGQGFFIDVNGKKWEGEFAKGSYQSKMQNELRLAKEIKLKQSKIKAQAQNWFVKFGQNFAKSDKKTFKQNLIGHFATQEQVKTHVKDPYPKFQERPPQKWNESLALMKNAECVVLKSNTQAKQLEPDRILTKQFNGLGQIVQFKSTVADRILRASLCLITQQLWVLVFYHDSTEPEKKK